MDLIAIGLLASACILIAVLTAYEDRLARAEQFDHDHSDRDRLGR